MGGEYVEFVLVHPHILKLFTSCVEKTVFIIGVLEDKTDAGVVAVLPALVFTVLDDLVQTFTGDIQRLVINDNNDGFIAIRGADVHIWPILGELPKTVDL